MIHFNCYRCNYEIMEDARLKLARTDYCPSCKMPMKCCRNCRFYDEKAHHQCRETQAEFVEDKTAANFCEYFYPKKPEASLTQKSEEAKKKLEALFGNSK